MDRHGPAVVVDLPDIGSADIKSLAARRDAEWKAFASVGTRHPPLVRNPTPGGIEQRAPNRLHCQVRKALPGGSEEVASFVARRHRRRERGVYPMQLRCHNIEGR